MRHQLCIRCVCAEHCHMAAVCPHICVVTCLLYSPRASVAPQKRLIAKTEEVVEKELLIQEKEKLYVELKHILARQPGPEVAEQLQIYQQTLREKTKQMKVRNFMSFIVNA